MKKFLLFLILLIPMFNIKAITFCDGTELPDIPLDNNYTDYIIVEYIPSSIYRLITFNSNNTSVYISNNTLYINNGSPRMYTLNNNSWGAYSLGNRTFVLSNDNIVFATTIDIINNSNNELVYNANYNIECFSPDPDIPQDFSIINYVANIFNNFVSGLQQNNISIHIVFIGLIIFNLLVFIICYIITHLE